MNLSDSFRERLKEAIGKRSVNSFAKECGTAEGAIRNYLKGQTTPNLDTLEKIATVSGRSLAWLASGETAAMQATPAINEELLVAVMEAVEDYLLDKCLKLTTAKKAQLVAALYEMAADEDEKVVDMKNVIRLVKLAA